MPPRPLTKIYARAERLRLDVWISSKEVKEKAFANVDRARWKSFADYMRAVLWLASENIILVKPPRPEKKRKRKRKKRASLRKQRPGFEFDEVSRRWRKAKPATISVMQMD